MSGALRAAALGFGAWLLSTLARPAAAGDVGQWRETVERINAGDGLGLNPADVLAVIEIESGGDPSAYRYEAHLDDASIGLMQILSTTARDRGYRGPVAGLFDPETNIRLGMRHLAWGRDYLRSRLGASIDKGLWIGAYNAGVGNAVKGYTPLGYVEKFNRARARYA